MYLAIAIVLFAIVFACSSAQQYKKDRQYEEYKSRQRQKTIREYYYAQFYFLELVQKLISVFEEYKQCGPLFDRDTMGPNPKAVEIEERWKFEILTVNYQEYKLEDIAVCKARERVIAEGYLPSDPYLHEYSPAYNPWKFPERHQYTVLAKWPRPPWMHVSTYSKADSDYQNDIRDLDEVAEQFGYHNFCDTVLHLRHNEATGKLYSEPAAEPCPCEPLKEKLLGDIPEWGVDLYNTKAVLMFGLRAFQIQ